MYTFSHRQGGHASHAHTPSLVSLIAALGYPSPLHCTSLGWCNNRLTSLRESVCGVAEQSHSVLDHALRYIQAGSPSC